MHESRPILGPPMDIDWSRRRTLLNRSVLVAAILLAVLGIASFWTQPIIAFELSSIPAIALIASAVWMLVAYLFGRAHRTDISGWMLVLFSLVWLSFALYVLPDYTLPLLPAALLPVGLAVLLLNRASVLVASGLVASAVLLMTSGVLPPSPFPPPVLPLAPIDLGVTVAVVSGIVLALLLIPLRTSALALSAQLRQREAAHAQLLQERRAVEQERDAALNTIARQRQSLEALVGQIRDGVIAIADNGEVIHANPIARQLYTEAMREDGSANSLAHLERSLVVSEGGVTRVEVIPLPSFGLSPEESYTHVLIDNREQARLARLRGELLGLLTDEMRNPLTSMVTALDLTLGQNDLPEEIDRVLIGARQSGQRLLELVTMLLEISQIEQNSDVLRRTNIPLSRVIEAGIAQMSPLAQRGAVTVTVEHAGDSVIGVDGERIQRAFAYLLEQALRQSPPYSVVQVRTSRGDGQLVVQITDQGPGRATQQSEQLFRQGADERNASSLGLIYSKLVIEAHGGRVWAESNGGQGSSYNFSLPVERQELLRAGE